MMMHSLESTAGKMCTVGKTLYRKDSKALGENTWLLIQTRFQHKH